MKATPQGSRGVLFALLLIHQQSLHLLNGEETFSSCVEVNKRINDIETDPSEGFLIRLEDDDPQTPTHCELELDGGGWTYVFQFVGGPHGLYATGLAPLIGIRSLTNQNDISAYEQASVNPVKRLERDTLVSTNPIQFPGINVPAFNKYKNERHCSWAKLTFLVDTDGNAVFVDEVEDVGSGTATGGKNAINVRKNRFDLNGVSLSEIMETREDKDSRIGNLWAPTVNDQWYEFADSEVTFSMTKNTADEKDGFHFENIWKSLWPGDIHEFIGVYDDGDGQLGGIKAGATISTSQKQAISTNPDVDDFNSLEYDELFPSHEGVVTSSPQTMYVIEQWLVREDACALGTYINSDGDCDECSAGKYTNERGLLGCLDCAAGYYANQPGQSACLGCEPGLYARTGSSTCSECGGGLISTESLQSSCSPCERGAYQPNTGMTRCLECDLGKFQGDVGKRECINCDISTYQDESGATACKDCPDGETSALGQSQCEGCEPGKYRDSSMSECGDCTAGRYHGGYGASVCFLCRAGHVSSRGSRTCNACEAGLYSPSDELDTCTTCEAGKYSNNTGATVCLECEPGEFSAERSTACAQCDKGYFATPTRDDCIRCSMGQYAPSAGSSGCLECPSGKYGSAEGMTDCNPCPSGKYASSKGAYECADCRIDTFSVANDTNGATVCESCELGYYSSQGASVCSVCDAGKGIKEGQSECVDCEVGFFSNATGHCEMCPMGRHTSESGTNQCADCPAGTYTDVLGSSACSDCSAGKMSAAGASSCTSCPEGTIQPNTGGAECLDCDEGFFNNATGRTFCDPCQPGKFASQAGLSACIDCSSATASSVWGSANCSACDRATYAPESGQAACIPCPPGRFGVEGAQVVRDSLISACLQCAPGSYSPLQQSSTCLSCFSTKQYQTQAGQSHCQSCPINSETVFVEEKCTVADREECCVCKIGSYGVGSNCEECPENADCGSEDEDLLMGPTIPVPNPGFWLTSNASVVACIPTHACTGGNDCAEGYDGDECKVCALSYYRLEENCNKCPDGGRDIWYAVAVTIFFFLPVILRRGANLIGKLDPSGEGGGTSMLMAISIGELVSFMQTVAILGQFDLDWPDEVWNFIVVMGSVAFDLQAMKVECDVKDFHSRWKLTMATPFLFIFVFLFDYVIQMLRNIICSSCTGFFKPPSMVEVKRQSVRLVMIVLATFYVTLVAQTLIPINCVEGVGNQVLKVEPSVECNMEDSQYAELVYLSVASSVAVLFGIPGVFLCVLLKNVKGHMHEDAVKMQYGFLFEKFEPKYFYWDVMLLLRKAGLTVIALFIRNVVSQTVISLCTLQLILFVQLYARPYLDDWVDVMVFATTFAHSSLLSLGLLFRMISVELVSDDFSSIGGKLAIGVIVAAMVVCTAPWLLHLMDTKKKSDVSEKSLKKMFSRDGLKRQRRKLTSTANKMVRLSVDPRTKESLGDLRYRLKLDEFAQARTKLLKQVNCLAPDAAPEAESVVTTAPVVVSSAVEVRQPSSPGSSHSDTPSSGGVRSPSKGFLTAYDEVKQSLEKENVFIRKVTPKELYQIAAKQRIPKSRWKSFIRGHMVQ